MFRYIDRKRQLIRSFYTGIGKSAVLFPATFIVALGHGLVTLGVIFYIREVFHATPSQVGYFTALWSMCFILGCIFIRPLSDRILPRYVLICATFLKSLFIVLILFVKSMAFAYLFYGFFGLSISFFWPPLMGWLSRGIEGAELGKLMSRYNFSWSIGSIISPLLAGLLSKRNPAFPLIIGSFLFLSASLLLTGASIALPKIRQDMTVNFNKNDVSAGVDNSTPLRFPAWVGIFTTYMVIGVIVNIFPVFALEKTSLDKTAIGFLLQARALFAAIGFIYMGRTTFWHFLPSQMLIGQGGLAACVLLMIFTTSALPIAIVISCIGISMAFSYSNSLFHGVSGSINRSGRMAVHESLISSGLIVGSVAGGVLYQKFSMILVYNFCAVFILLGILIQGLLIWLSARKKPNSKGL